MPPFEKARRLAGLEVPDNWQPSPEERLWLEELEALTDDEIESLERYTQPPVDVLEEVPPEELNF